MYIALDIGNVLVRFDIKKFITKFNDLCYEGIIETKIDPKQFLFDLNAAQDCGLVTVEQRARERFNWDPDNDVYITNKLSEAWKSTIIPVDIMNDFFEGLKSEGVNVALLSNMGYEHAQLFRDKWPKFFKDCTLHLSCDVGARKPSKLYYQSFLADHPEFKGCIYLDDRPENVIAGHKYGFKVDLFDLEDFLTFPKDRQNGHSQRSTLASIRDQVIQSD